MSIAPLKLVRLLFRWFPLRGMSGDRRAAQYAFSFLFAMQLTV